MNKQIAKKLTEQEWEDKRIELCNCGIDSSLLSLHEEWCAFRKFALRALIDVCGDDENRILKN